MKAKIEVKNVPDSALDKPYWVVNIWEGEAWFWGAWTIKDEAVKVAKSIGGILVENDN